MRNLKKILALVLALVMSFSLMATANAFTDDEKITDTYETAVTVLSGLKVFQGYDDGSFLPQGSITRAEVAAIIYRIVTGDVEDKQVGIYADYNKFNDVKSTSWYAGYVNFCANAEYIKGRDAKTFDPNSYVTGYEALAMILRAIGYDKNGEFTGANWQVQTAATGELRGITKNITEGTLGTYASREVVAEILFQTILVDTVNYTPAFGYQLNDTSLGWDTFELEEIEGVVVANEYADLYSTSPLKAGKTELDVDGESYMLDYATALTDIGEARAAYVTEGKNVLYIADAGNTVFETGAETDISTSKKFESATGLELDEDVVEYFINFDNGMQDSAEVAEYFKITYVKVGTQHDANPVTKEVKYRVGAELDKDDLADLKTSIETLIRMEDEDNFNYKSTDVVKLSNVDYYAQSFAYGRDYQLDEVNYENWKGFSNKYLVNNDEIATYTVEDSENGEWLKVIDNDGDGVADYVLKTEFVMSVINRISKSGDYTLAAWAATDEPESFTYEVIDEDDIITEDELAEDDVVIYTLIDGNYYMNIAEKVTETVDKKGINKKTETMTCGGTDYVQSHIGYGDAGIYESSVRDAHTEYTYDLYLDYFGYVRLFVESDYSAFMLLTDGYYETDRHNEAFRAEYWNVDAAEKQEIDVADGDADDFINVGTDNNNGDRETWRRLIGAGYFYFDAADYNVPFITNIVGYSEGSDGYTLIAANDTTRRTQYDVQWLTADEDTDLDTEILTGRTYDKDTEAWSNANRIQTTTNTQYYVVIRDTDRFDDDYVDTVVTWTGYNNVPDEAELGDWALAYAVTHAGTGTYDVADVVVFETNDAADHNTYFVYTHNNYDATRPEIEHVWGLGYGEDGEIVNDMFDVEDEAYVIWNNHVINFYEIYDDSTVDYIGNNYAEHNIYAGVVDVEYDVSGNNYIQVVVDNVDDGYLRFNPNDIPIYMVTGDADADQGEYNVDDRIGNWDDIKEGYQMILFTDSKENVEYAIVVDMSTYENAAGNDVIYSDVQDLYDRIWNDAHPVYVPVLTINDSNLENAEAVAATAVEQADGTYNVTVTLTSDTGYSFRNRASITATLVDAANGTVPANADWTISANKKAITFTVTGLEKDNTLVVTGKALADGITITLDENGGTDVADLTGDYGDAVPAPAKPTKTGYTFASWEPALPETFPAEDMTVKAQWTENVYDVVFKYVDENGNEINSRTVQNDKLYTEAKEIVEDFAAPAIPGYEFVTTTAAVYGDNDTTVEISVEYKAVVKLIFTVTSDGGFTYTAPTQTTIDKAGEDLTMTISYAGWGNGGTYTGDRYVHVAITGADNTTTVFTATEPATPGTEATVTIPITGITGDTVEVEVTAIDNIAA